MRASKSSTFGLELLGDDDLRVSVRLDVSSSEAALNAGHWKAATVLVGAALEALLLWEVKRDGDARRRSAIQTAEVSLKLSRSPNEWNLDHYIKVARELVDISEQTADQARLAKDFRNLVHPGARFERG
jgi:hypothetical protein